MAPKMQRLQDRLDEVCRCANRKVFRKAVRASDVREARRLAAAALVRLASMRPKDRPLLECNGDVGKACRLVRSFLRFVRVQVEAA